ncbi:hypothetical protein L7F22_036867 [Adiantum nelumboides]|nr:hypothetical protein [Adiantum nelumboides]
MSHTFSPHQAPSSPHFEDASMNPELMPSLPMEQLFQAVSDLIVQVNQTNQALINENHTNQILLNQLSTTNPARPDPKIRPKPFSGLATDDVLSWLDHFQNVATYQSWSTNKQAMEASTLLEGVASTWYIQQSQEVKQDWHILKSMLIQDFAHNNITETALQQLKSLKQQHQEPVAQFAVKMTQLLLRADPTMSEEMKLFFLWPRLRHDISRRVRDQGPTSFQSAIQIAQRIESNERPEEPSSFHPPPVPTNTPQLPIDTTSPMDVDV